MRISIGIDSFLLSILRCPDCLTSALRTSGSNAELSCPQCQRSYPVMEPGIPSLCALEMKDRISLHEKSWDGYAEDNYEEVVHALAAIIEVIDRIAMRHCRGTILEVGCGRGRFLRQVSQMENISKAVGLDVSVGMLRAAWRRGLRLLVHGSGERLPFADGIFDTVVSTFSSLAYVDRAKGYVEISRVLRKDGTLVFDLLKYWPELIDTAWRRFRSTGRWPRGLTNDYLLRHKLRDPRREVRMLEAAGFRLMEMKSPPYLPLLRRKIRKPWCWNGYLGSAFGFDTIFVARKVES